MKNFLFLFFLLFFALSTSSAFAKTSYYLDISKNGESDITFETIEVTASSVEEQIINIDNVSGNYKGIIGFALVNEPPNDYLKQLPFQEYFDGKIIIRYEIAYSPSNTSIVLVRTIYNHTDDDMSIPEKSMYIEWYLCKRKLLR